MTETTRHGHRCMRCRRLFACCSPPTCAAAVDVLPRLPIIERGGVVGWKDHCVQDHRGVWVPIIGERMEYRGYTGRATYDAEVKVWFGEVENLRDVVTFEAKEEPEVESAFRASVDDYLDMLAARSSSSSTPHAGGDV